MGKNCFTFIVLLIMAPLLFTGCGTTNSPAQSKANQALEWKKQGNMEMYRYGIKEARFMDPNDVFLMNDMANIYWAENKIPEAKAQFEECIEKGKDVMIGNSEIQKFVGKPMSEICKFNLDKLEKYAQAQEKIKRRAAVQPDIDRELPPKQQIEKKYVTMDEASTEPKPLSIKRGEVKSVVVAAHEAYLRSGPSLTSSSVGYVTKGTLLSISGKSKDNDGRLWYSIKLPVSQKAWISERVVIPIK